MSVVYAFKRVFRSWKLFATLLIGMITASSFFAGINISVDNVGFKSLQQQLEQVYADIVIASSSLQILPPQKTMDIRDKLLSVEGIKSVDVISKVVLNAVSPKPAYISLPDGSNVSLRIFVDAIIGISRGSHIYKQMVLEGKSELGLNEAFIEIESDIASKLKVGDTITVAIPIVSSTTSAGIHYIKRVFRVSGYVIVDDPSYFISLGIYIFPTALAIRPSIIRRVTHNFIFVDWESTFAEILDEAYAYNPSYTPIVTNLLAYLDRESLLDPWDIDGSRNRVNKVVSILTNIIRTDYGEFNIQVTNNIGNVLLLYGVFSTFMILQGIILSLPVFFVSWYLGLTISDLSYNIRRREIGLLLSKGFTERQLLKIFLTEAALIGVISAAAGLILGIIFTPLFTLGQVTGLPILRLDSMVFIVAFSIIITFLSVLQPARRAANLKPAEALREFFSIKRPEPYKKIWVWLAFGLGIYKIIMLLLGLSLNDILPPAGSVLGGRGGFLTAIILSILRFMDNILLYIGPVLFFWGFTKIFVAQSLKFQSLLIKTASPLMKDLSLLAERNVQRNAARIASTTFLLSLIVGYAVSSLGQVATQEDYTRRLIYESIGSDLGVSLNSTGNAFLVKETLLRIEGVESVAIEYRGFSGQTALGADQGLTQLAAINPEEWLKTAYYEDEWFIGGPARDIIKSLSNNTIILEGRFSEYISIGENVSIVIGGKNFNLMVIGFYGPKSESISNLPQAQQIRLRLISRSFISESIYVQVKKSVSSRAYLLVRLREGANPLVDKVVEEIKKLPGVEWVASASEQIRLRRENFLLSGALNISQLGVFFSTVAASVGSALVTIISLIERRKEITLLMVRGFTVKQVASILLAENLSALLLAVLVGGFVGYLVHKGNVSSSAAVAGVVAPRIVFPPETLMNLIITLVLLASSIIVPIIVTVIYRSNRLTWRE